MKLPKTLEGWSSLLVGIGLLAVFISVIVWIVAELWKAIL